MSVKIENIDKKVDIGSNNPVETVISDSKVKKFDIGQKIRKRYPMRILGSVRTLSNMVKGLYP
jgi:hypothetical protein